MNSPAVLTLDEAILRFGREKRNGRRVVFTNGCFDILHPGHIRSLEQARDLGDALIIGLAIELAWAVFFILLSRWLFRLGLRRYSAYGG